MENVRPTPVLIWLRGMRAPFFSASIVPVLVGAAAALSISKQLHWLRFAITLLGMVALHAAANMLNDYQDYKSGCDPNNAARTIFNGGSNVIADGLMSERTMRIGIAVAYALGIACGLFLAVSMGPQGWVVLVLGVVGVAISLGYTAPRVLLAGRGLGEVGIALCFGLLAVQGTAYVQLGRFTWSAWLAALPVTGLIVAILWINQFPDIAADHAVGKDNLVVRLGPACARWGYYALLGLSYLPLIGGAAGGLLPPWALLGLGGLPLAWRAARILHRHYAQTAALLPAQAATIQAHLLTGLFLAAGLTLGAWV